MEKLLHWVEQEAGYLRYKSEYVLAEALESIVRNTRAALDDERHDGKIVVLKQIGPVEDDHTGDVISVSGRTHIVGQKIGGD